MEIIWQKKISNRPSKHNFQIFVFYFVAHVFFTCKNARQENFVFASNLLMGYSADLTYDSSFVASTNTQTEN